MKKILILSVAALLAAGAYADDKLGFKIISAGGEKTYEMSQIDHITFEENRMHVHHSEGVDEHMIDEIDEMVFATISGIEGVQDFDLGNNLMLNVDHGMLSAILPGGEISLTIYEMGGAQVATANANGELNYNLAELTTGVYIIRVNDKTIKFIR